MQLMTGTGTIPTAHAFPLFRESKRLNTTAKLMKRDKSRWPQRGIEIFAENLLELKIVIGAVTVIDKV
jgi:hypothetical protein